MFFLLILVNTILARPQDSESEDPKKLCSSYFSGKKLPISENIRTKLSIDNEKERMWKEDDLTYKCATTMCCFDDRDKNGINKFGAEDVLNILRSSAQNAKCLDEGEICCKEENVIKNRVKRDTECTEISGYSCVPNPNCNGKVETDSKMKSDCFNTNNPTDEKICCNDNDVIEVPPPCSELPEYRCTPDDQCEKDVGIVPRSSFINNLITPEILAKTASCSSKSDICCHEANIMRPCEDYSADGYKCSKTCMDVNQPTKAERKTNIEHYFPKSTICPFDQTCCRNTEIKTTPCGKGASCLCSDFGPEKKCLRLEDCEISKSIGSNEIADTTTAPDIGSLFARTARLFEQNDQNSIIVNKPLNPCASIAPQTVCCVPKPKTPEECPSGFIPSDDPDCPCKPESRPVTCGTHNENGIPRNGISMKISGISSQEGEWPHACLIFHKNKVVGGASLITPKVLVTAAHILEIEKGNPDATKVTDLKIRCGEHDLKSSENEILPHQDKKVETFTIHPFYSGSKTPLVTTTLENDFAIIHTTEEFEITQNVNPICLPKPDLPYSETNCYSMGWGVNSFEETEIKQDIMKQIRLRRVPDSQKCQKSLIETNEITKVFKLHSSQTCAQASRENSTDILCNGDGGGSLVCQEHGEGNRNVLAGVISFGIGCGRTDIPDVFANVQKALCFIDYEVKCKHGRQFLNHFDYQTECSTWFKDQLEEAELLRSFDDKFEKRYFGLNSLAKTCNDQSNTGQRSEGLLNTCLYKSVKK